MRAKHLVPNSITLANIILGFFSMIAASDGQYRRACVLLFLAGLCDLLDGRLARLLGASSLFGKELDSLSDVVSFGIAPALLLFHAVLRPLGGAGAAAVVLYLSAGALRLARYNIDEDELSQHTFKGLTIPMGAAYVISFVMARDFLPLWLTASATVVVALGMVSTAKIPNFRRGGLPPWMMLVGIASFVVFLLSPSLVTWHVWNAWNFVMLGANYVMLARLGLVGARDRLPA